MKKNQQNNISWNALVEHLKKASLVQSYCPRKSSTSWNQRICVKSSTVQAGDAFLAMKGTQFDSHSLIQSLYKKGVRHFIVEDQKKLGDFLHQEGVSWVELTSSRKAWSYAESFLCGQQEKNMKILAITGTNGKTSVAWMLTHVLRACGKKAFYIGTLGSSLKQENEFSHTTPDPDVLFPMLRSACQQEYDFCVIEVSSHALKQEKLGPILFDGAAMTSFSRDHLDYHKTMEDYWESKKILFTRHLKNNATVFIHKDLEAKEKGFFSSLKQKVFFYDMEDEKFNEHLSFSKNLSAKDLKTLPYRGKYNHDNFVCALLLASKFVHLDSSFPFHQLPQIPGRMEKVGGSQKSLEVYVDFAHTPDGLSKLLKSLRGTYTGGLWLVFGCGGDRDVGKRAEMAQVAEIFCQNIILTSDNPRNEDPKIIIKDILKGFQKPDLVRIEEDRKKAIYKALSLAKAGDTVLIVGKGHECFQEVKGQKFKLSDRKLVEDFFSQLDLKPM